MFSGVKVFSATKHKERDELGETVLSPHDSFAPRRSLRVDRKEIVRLTGRAWVALSWHSVQVGYR